MKGRSNNRINAMTKRIVLLQALASTPIDVTRIACNSKPSLTHRRPQPDSWSMADVLFHLIDVEQRYRHHLQRVVAEDQPNLPSLLPDEESLPPQATAVDLAQEFAAARSLTMSFLNELSPKDWQRRAFHQRHGETSLRYLVQRLVDHDTLHLNQLLEVREQTTANSEQSTINSQLSTTNRQRSTFR
jgi:uncharacterized damage-inducible protein DinB